MEEKSLYEIYEMKEALINHWIKMEVKLQMHLEAPRYLRCPSHKISVKESFIAEIDSVQEREYYVTSNNWKGRYVIALDTRHGASEFGIWSARFWSCFILVFPHYALIIPLEVIMHSLYHFML